MELSRYAARYLLDGMTTMASESYAATDFSGPPDDTWDFWALVEQLMDKAELDEGERHYFMAFFRRRPVPASPPEP